MIVAFFFLFQICKHFSLRLYKFNGRNALNKRKLYSRIVSEISFFLVSHCFSVDVKNTMSKANCMRKDLFGTYGSRSLGSVMAVWRQPKAAAEAESAHCEQ